MKVQINSKDVIEMSSEDAARATQEYFERHGMNFEYVRISDYGEIQLKMHSGFKVRIRPTIFGTKIALC